MKQLSIWFVGLGTQANFVENRILAAQEQGMSITALVDNPTDFNKIPQSSKIVFSTKNHRKNLFLLLFRFWINPRFFVEANAFFKKRNSFNSMDRLSLISSLLVLTLQKKPDIIHVQWLLESIKYKPLANYWKIPLVGSARGSQVNFYPYLNEKNKEQLFAALKETDYVHSVGIDMKTALVAWGVNPEKVFVNYNGFNPKMFFSSPRQPHNELKILTVGSWIPRKNLTAIASIAVELRTRNIPFTWTIVGGGADFLKGKFLLERTGIPFLFKEKTSQENLRLLYQNADIFVGTSLAEGVCNAVLEAMACGCIPVVFQSGGMGELIESGKSGFIIPNGDVVAMAETIETLFKNPDMKPSFSKNAEEHVLERFPIAFHTNLMVEFYQKISSQ